ncbi:MAG TPA: twin-arginine translocase subunit TatB, partial [Acidimicrobiaceae bacterium]|nr:twin-arginine translocase subunit TatB [Acidimicrobiaceae bacterium]
MAAGEAAREVAAPRLTAVFNIQGSEMIFLLLVALVILGPEKLPEAVRKFAKTYAEFKKMANGFQGEFRQALDEPMREFRETANAVRDAAKFDIDGITSPSATPEPAPTPGSTAVSE